MSTLSWAKTANRSVVGSMTDFVFLAEHQPAHQTNNPDLVELSVWLSRTPCSPLDKTHFEGIPGSPDREVIALTGPDETGGPSR
ncbi:MAG: hypothetical protein GY773_09300 [Actinomycetia bacterium]|nr:hypothetical protein [Actinomycetes bacterium]